MRYNSQTWYVKFACTIALCGALVACGGGSETPTTPPTTSVPPAANNGAVSDAGQRMGIVFLQVTRNDQVALSGEIYQGALTVNYGNSNGANVTYTTISGVASNLEKNSAGQWVFQVDATNLAAGDYAYAIRAKDSQTNAEAEFTGTVKVVQPIETKTAQLTNAGLSLNVAQGELKFSANNLTVAIDVTVKVIPVDGGLRYIIQSPVSLKDNGIKILLPAGATPTLVDKAVSMVQAFKASAIRLMQTGSTSPGLNYSPYSTLPTNIDGTAAKNNFDEKSLGILFKQGDSGQAFQYAVSPPSLTNVLPVTLAGPVAGLTAAAAQQAMQFMHDAGPQRFWDNPVPYAGTADNWWNVPWEVVKQATSSAKYEITVDQKSAWELHTSIQGDPAKFDWTNYEPVLFIHGFAPSYGGGEATWSSFPKLALQTQLPNGKSLVPFEFRWRSTQSFRLAADDLADAIGAIYNASGGKPVHIVSHSFGGVLTRVLLQGLSKTPSRADAAKKRVASFMSLGSPHSGISSENKTIGGTTIPKGAFQSVDLIALCQSVSCYEMGGNSFLLYANLASYFQDLGLTGDYQTKGMLTAKLNETANNLPAIPIYQGIGMQALLVSSPAYAADGDGLISFAGQRFQASASDAAGARPLLNQAKIGLATVTEVILGWSPTIRYNNEIGTNKLPTKRAGGYAHSSISGLANGNVGVSDGGGLLDRGLEAAPTFECDAPASCTHASYLLFKQLQGDKLNLSNIQYAYENQLPAEPLQPSQSIGLTPEQLTQAQTVLDGLVVKNVISGRHINWNKLSAADQLSAWNALLALPNNPTVTALNAMTTQAQQSLNGYYTRELEADNRSSGFQGLYGGGALKDWLKVAGAEVKVIKGVLSAAYPAVAFAADGGVVVNTTPQLLKMIENLDRLSKLESVLSLMNDCPLVFIEYQEALTSLNGGDTSGPNLLKALTLPLTCLATVLDKGDVGNQAKFVKLFSDSVGLADGTKVAVVQILVDSLDIGLALMPKSVNLSRAKGVLDVAAATFDAYVAGQQMADRADKAYVVEQAEMDARSKAWDARQQASRIQILLSAKGAYLFEPIGNLASINTSATSVSLGGTVNLWLSSAWTAIKQVVWTFSDSVATFTASVANGVSTAVSQSFATIGSKTITATFKDALEAVLGQSTATITVAAATLPTASITTATSDTTTQPGDIASNGSTDDTTPTLSGTISAVLTSGQKVNVYDGANMFAAVAVVSGTNWSFTPATPLIGGSHSFTAAVATFDGTEGGRSSAFVVNVLSTSVASIAPGEIIRTLAGSFEVVGRDLPSSGLAVTVPGDAKASCQTPNNMKDTGFNVACTFYQLGAQTLEIRSGGQVLGTVTVQVKTNVTGVTWTAPSTTNSGTVMFGETVTFKVAGVNLLADTAMGFAVEKCGVSNTEVGTPGNTLRSFACNFNNQAGAVAAQMPGVVKDAPDGQVLFEGWNVPVEVASTTTGTFTVAANSYAGTDFTVPAGTNSCSFTAPGTWSFGAGSYDANGYTGTAVPAWANTRMTGVPIGRLVATTPDGYKSVGTSATHALPAGSVLTFVMNDDANLSNAYSDNSGSLTVSYSCSVTASTTTTGKLPDTGITANQCYAAGSNAFVSCTSAAAIALNDKQDGMVGRDASTPDNSDGKLGFSYTKLDASGNALAASATSWSCVKDNITGLTWEIKTADGGLRDKSKTYTNYGDGRSGDASAFAAAVNTTSLCGYTDWRLPTAFELQGIVDYGVAYPGPIVDSAWFINTVGTLYWSSSPYAGGTDFAWGVSFYDGVVYNFNRYGGGAVRLVR